MESIKMILPERVVAALHWSGLTTSHVEARKAISRGEVSVNGQQVTDTTEDISGNCILRYGTKVIEIRAW